MIFLGAGASQPFYLPTSKELTLDLINELDKKFPALLKDIEYSLTNYNYSFDYENILIYLNVLTNPQTVPRTHHSHRFRGGYGNYIGDYSEIIDYMYQLINEKCTLRFNRDQMEILDQQFFYTYDALLGLPLSKNKGESVFSTNYDPSIEMWCQRRNIECFDGTINTKNPDVTQMLVGPRLVQHFTDNNMRDPSKQNLSEILPLVRLHGTVLGYETNDGKYLKFNKIPDELLHKDVYEGKIKNSPLLIFPGQEHLLSRNFWDYHYQFYKENLKKNCLFIGYSFRHDVINNPIIDYLDNGRIEKLGIFCPNPDKNLENLFGEQDIPEEKIVRIKGEFGTEKGIQEYVRNWYRFYIDEGIDDIDGCIHQINNWLAQRNSIYS